MKIKKIIPLIGINFITRAFGIILTPSGFEIPKSLEGFLSCPNSNVECKNDKVSSCTKHASICYTNNPEILKESHSFSDFDIGNMTIKEYCNVHMEVCDMIMDYNPLISDKYICNLDQCLLPVPQRKVYKNQFPQKLLLPPLKKKFTTPKRKHNNNLRKLKKHNEDIINKDPNCDEDGGPKYKVLVIGDYAVGKTSLIRRYTEGYFTPNYKLTIGVDFAVKKLPEKETKVKETNPETGEETESCTLRPPMTLQLWDIAGHERFGSMTRVYYKYAIAAVVVFDIGRPTTFDAVEKWKEDVDSKVVLPDGNHIPCLLLANKVDTVMADKDDTDLSKAPAGLSRSFLNSYAEEHGFIGWFPTSASDNLNVDDAMDKLADAIAKVAKENTPQEPQRDVIVPEATEPEPQPRKCC